MRAVLSEVVGGPASLVLREVDPPELYPGGVRVRVRAAAANFPDLLSIEDKYQFRPPRPFSPGGEVSGEVLEVGAGVTHLAPGARVLANVGFGGFAEQVVSPAERTWAMPEGMSFEAGASLLYTYATTYHALVDRAALRAGERMLVLGAAGGVGVAAIQLGKALGAEVVAAARGEEKLAFCRAQGAAHAIDYEREDLKQRLKELGGVDVVYDAVGGAYAEPALRALRPFGRFLVIGFAAGSIPKLPLNLVLLKECSVVGVQWGAWSLREPEAQSREVEALFALWQRGAIAPHIDASYPLERAAEALTALAERRVRGKVVVLP